MSQIHHQHGNKTNLSRYVRGQCRVALAAIVKRSGCNTPLPLLLRLTPYTKEEIKRLPLNKETVHLYGREQQVNYRTAEAKARFLNGQSVCFVWCEFEDSKGKKDHVYYCQQICS